MGFPRVLLNGAIGEYTPGNSYRSVRRQPDLLFSGTAGDGLDRLPIVGFVEGNDRRVAITGVSHLVRGGAKLPSHPFVEEQVSYRLRHSGEIVGRVQKSGDAVIDDLRQAS